jgi:hypothetical protein
MLAIMLAKNISQQYLKIHWQYLNKHYHSLQQNHLSYDKSKSVIQSLVKNPHPFVLSKICTYYIYKDTTKQKTKRMKCSNIESNTEFHISGTLNQYFTILLLLFLPGPFWPDLRHYSSVPHPDIVLHQLLI